MGIPEAAIEDIRAKTRALDGNESLAFALVAVAIEGAQIAEPHISRAAFKAGYIRAVQEWVSGDVDPEDHWEESYRHYTEGESGG